MATGKRACKKNRITRLTFILIFYPDAPCREIADLWMDKVRSRGAHDHYCERSRSSGGNFKLDGCYVLKTALSQTADPKDAVHDGYNDLTLVEWAFRESETTHLEMRPVHVRLETRTRGHPLVLKRAHSIIRAPRRVTSISPFKKVSISSLPSVQTKSLLPDRSVS